MMRTPNQRSARLTRQEIEQISLELTEHLTAYPPLQVVRQGSGLHLRFDYEFAFPAKITGGSQPYSWQEVIPNPNGTFQVPAVARTGSLSVNEAWEMNGNTAVPSGVYVLMTKGYFNFGSSGQEYVFSYTASTTMPPPPPTGGTKAVPLMVTSGASQGGLWPAVILTYNPATNTFSNSGQAIWAITTNQNLLSHTNYTGILIGHGGNPALDIYCINDNLLVGSSDGVVFFFGLNQILLDKPYTWNIAAGVGPGQVVVERLLTIQDERGSPPVEHTYIEQFQPYYTWEIKQDPLPGKADIRRLFDVFVDQTHVQTDVCQLIFTPACMWDVEASGLGGVTIRRILNVAAAGAGTIPNVANIVFTPNCAWSVTSGGSCTAVVERLFTVQTDSPSDGVFNDVAGIRFLPSCSWTIAADNGVACGVTVKRDFVVKDDASARVEDVAQIEFHPSYTWDILSDTTCSVQIQRILYVNTCGPDIWQINLSTSDFVVQCLGLGGVSVKTLGFTGSVLVCMGDNFLHTWTFQDGLLQSIV